jgi:hypothetical protein
MKPDCFSRSPLLLLQVFLLILAMTAAPAGADTTVGGTISTDTTWDLAGSPYIVTSNITVKGTDGADAITTLQIEPGVEVRMTLSRQFIVGGTSGDPGALVAQGTAAQPIVFTSDAATPAAGDWYGFRFYATSDDASTILDHCTVGYAGSTKGCTGRKSRYAVFSPVSPNVSSQSVVTIPIA